MPARTIHNIPLILRPFFLLFGWIVGVAFFLHQRLYRILCRIEYAGKEHIEQHPGHILCVWHENLPLFFISHPYFRHPNIWMTYPLWFMKPIHIMKKLIGIQELAYGASGIDGKAALQQVLDRLEEGWSTFLSPDGPKGPLKVAKDGVLLMSMKTGSPVIPIQFWVERDRRINSWDRKRYPRLGTKMVVAYGEPVFVTEENWEAARKQISEGMSDPFERPLGDRSLPDL
ncbi:MAG: hypothetical protein AAF587_37880 [Bacteroidota bacterium]